MCDHFLSMHTYRQLQHSKVRWRCSVCGRESSRPLDCCTRAYAACTQRPSMVRTLVRWAGGSAVQVLTGLQTLLRHRRRPAVDTPVETVTIDPFDALQRLTEATDTEEVDETTRVSV